MPKYQIRTEDGKVYTPTRKSKVLPNLVRNFRKSGHIYIKVIYGKDLYNHGTFSNYNDAKQFVDECTEPALIKYAQDWT
jgi:hypothetical protein